MKMSSGKRALDKIYKRRNRYEIPEWQRSEVWSRSKKQNLIDSILQGWKLPKFYFLKLNENPEEFEVVDGQQRLVAIFEFFDNELPLSPASEERFEATYYRDLTDILSDEFDDYEIEYDEIEEATDEEIKEFFQRLQEGLPLTSSEKLNSIHSKLRDFVFRLTNHKFFKEKVTVSDKRHGHFDITAKVAAIEVDGIEVGFRYDDLRAVFESQAEFSPRSRVAQRLKNTLDFLNKGFEVPSPNLRNRTIVQSLITFTAKIIETGRSDGSEKDLVKFFENFMKELAKQVELGRQASDEDYIAFQKTVSANVRSGPKIRQEILLRKLLASNPTFTAMFGPSAIEESGLSSHIKSKSGLINTLIGYINASYSSQYGDNLFKPTNRTVLSQNAIGRIINNYEEYKVLIENLYFIFHEGTGQRLAEPPESFVEINLLRTGLQHDIDHGSAGKVKAKRIKIGNVFKKYSGATSPETLAPEYFKVFQANLLDSLYKDLKSLEY